MFRSLTPFRRGFEMTDPFTSLQRQMNRLFEDFSVGLPALPGDGSAVEPSVDVKETDKTVEVEAELPGVDEKDIQVTFEDGVLTLKGEKKAEKTESKPGYYMSERSYGSFARALSIPSSIDVNKISADFNKGVLKVVLPKLAEAQTKAKKIEVNTGK